MPRNDCCRTKKKWITNKARYWGGDGRNFKMTHEVLATKKNSRLCPSFFVFPSTFSFCRPFVRLSFKQFESFSAFFFLNFLLFSSWSVALLSAYLTCTYVIVFALCVFLLSELMSDLPVCSLCMPWPSPFCFVWFRSSLSFLLAHHLWKRSLVHLSGYLSPLPAFRSCCSLSKTQFCHDSPSLLVLFLIFLSLPWLSCWEILHVLGLSVSLRLIFLILTEKVISSLSVATLLDNTNVALASSAANDHNQQNEREKKKRKTKTPSETELWHSKSWESAGKSPRGHSTISATACRREMIILWPRICLSETVSLVRNWKWKEE